MTIVISNIKAGEYYVKESLPDFGQHSGNWCWVAALANSLYWYATHGYPQLLDDPAAPGLDNLYFTTIIPETGCPSPEGGYRRLLQEIAIDAGKGFCEPIGQTEYLNAIEKFISDQGANLGVHVINTPGFDETTPVGPKGPTEPQPVVAIHPDVKVETRSPSFDDYKRELGRSQDVLLWLGDGDPDTIDHVVTGASYRIDAAGTKSIGIADPWNPGGPDHNNDATLHRYDEYQVLVDQPLQINYGSATQQLVLKLIFISPSVVGGFVVSVDKFGLLTPYIGLASTILVATVAAAIYVKRVKRRKEKQ